MSSVLIERFVDSWELSHMTAGFYFLWLLCSGFHTVSHISSCPSMPSSHFPLLLQNRAPRILCSFLNHYFPSVLQKQRALLYVPLRLLSLLCIPAYGKVQKHGLHSVNLLFYIAFLQFKKKAFIKIKNAFGLVA